jgi:hypothetical protein
MRAICAANFILLEFITLIVATLKSYDGERFP